MQQGRPGQAEAPLREALELHRKFEGDDHRHTVNAFDLLLRCLEQQGDWADMIPLQRRQLERLRRQRPPGHPETLSALAGLGRSLTEWAWTERPSETRNMKSEVPERAREAERLLRECLTAREAVTNLSRGVLGDTQSRLGGAVLAVAVTGTAGGGEGQPARLAEAERLLLSGHALMQRSTAAKPGIKRAGLERLARYYAAWDELAPNTGQAAQAAEWQQKLADFDRINANTKPAGAEP